MINIKRPQILLALDWYHPSIHRGVALFAKEHNWHLSSKTAFHHKLPVDWNGDGIITSVGARTEFRQFAAKTPFPVVTVGRNNLNKPYVGDNNAKIAEMAAQYFLNQGFRNFAFYYETPHSRGEMFAEVLRKNGRDCTMLFPEEKGLSWNDNWQRLKKHLKALPKPLAVFCADDNTAAEILEICYDSGIKMPEEVAVLGVHNDPIICENSVIPLSSIDINHFQIGYRAAEQLHKLMNGEAVEPNVMIFPTHVEVRQSTDVVAFENIEVVKAMRFIKMHYREPISVDDVVASTSISRRSLYTIFKQQVGGTIHAEIIRQRLRQVEIELERTDKTIKEISRDCGFSHVRVFNTLFKKKYGVTPNGWRKSL